MATESKKVAASKTDSTKPDSSKEPEFTCPECAAKGIKTSFKDARGRGVHRHAAHGIIGTSPSTVAYHQKKKTPAKKSHHKSTAPVVAPSAAVAIVPKKETSADQFSPVMIGYAMGKLESLAIQIARENKLPEQDFVRVAAYSFAELTKQR